MTALRTPTAAPGTPPTSTRRRAVHAEFMQIWEEGYVSNHISFENMHVPGLFIIDGAPLRREDGTLDRAKILAYIDATMASHADFRIRLQRSALGLTPPAWVPDEDFDLARHVLFTEDTADAATADLRRLSGAYDGLMSLTHPLWRTRVTELSDGTVALGTVMHHASLDGLSGMKTFSAICQKTADQPLPTPVDPWSGVRAATAWELPLLALRQWWQRQPSAAAAWRSYRSKPFLRRVRRVAARVLLPVRFGRGGEAARARLLPPIHSAYRRMDAGLVGRRARELGGSLSDLQVAAIIGAWRGPQRIVRLRFPVSYHSTDAPNVRNHVRDMEVAGDADAPLTETIVRVNEQVAARESALDGAPVEGYPIGYSTLLPWVSRPRYFCGGEVRALIPFPASLGTDQLAAAGIMYNGSLFIGANMPAAHDVEATVGRMFELMTGAPDPGRP
ncbi:wax ester/triacylglycerol synthase family O-acyltransferase [Microbacterium sp. zg.B48]|uniref:wax ester/triacylglycerol synthase family O-acyltransferase n=1 Tax=Microbacterium sp. zg.B48 TaxID=2969408 RepID=UPI00214C77E1|nr:wax ester/triacylglycerol synthase family O-acyltransferase [Microbacterium sp. zg.B48]MCR2763285.1 wax ester/triacylglycerol synthase family O-acyltransferase [Microbacterium sp. zg.B48]